MALRGNAPADQRAKITEYNTAMSKATLSGAPLFSEVKPATVLNAPNQMVNWSFDCELRPAGY